MITILTSELNRINQEIYDLERTYSSVIDIEELIIKKKQEKETLKKVSLMWANEEIKFLKEFVEMYDLHERHIVRIRLKKVSLMWADFILNYEVNKIDDLIDELKEIKSLIENQEDFQKLGSHEPSQMEKA